MVDIRDVARRADVSVATVSRVINDRPHVNRRTRRLVEQAMEELAYVPNQAARGLAKSRTQTIGFIAANLSHLMQMEGLPHVEAVVREHDYHLILCDCQNDPQALRKNLRGLFERRVEGLITQLWGDLPAELSLYTRSQIPYVVLDFGAVPFEVPKVTTDLTTAFREAVRYLVGLGHRRIALVSLSVGPSARRREEYRAALAELGLGYDPSLVVEADSGPGCRDRFRTLLASLAGPTAAIAGIHMLAPYVLEATYQAGLDVPRELSFITMGDSIWARAHPRPLTAVSYDRAPRYRAAASYLFARLAGESGEEYLKAAAARLAIRESCAPPRASLI